MARTKKPIRKIIERVIQNEPDIYGAIAPKAYHLLSCGHLVRDFDNRAYLRRACRFCAKEADNGKNNA